MRLGTGRPVTALDRTSRPTSLRGSSYERSENPNERERNGGGQYEDEAVLTYAPYTFW
jgi:hypothetical protein